MKLYVKRVFITDDEKDLLPPYLRFVRGIIDSEDLPLNVSREILQQNDSLASIKRASVKKLLGEFAKLSRSDDDSFQTFIEQFNRSLKESVHSYFENREELLELVRYKSTKEDGRNITMKNEGAMVIGNVDENKIDSEDRLVVEGNIKTRQIKRGRRTHASVRRRCHIEEIRDDGVSDAVVLTPTNPMDEQIASKEPGPHGECQRPGAQMVCRAQSVQLAARLRRIAELRHVKFADRFPAPGLFTSLVRFAHGFIDLEIKTTPGKV